MSEPAVHVVECQECGARTTGEICQRGHLVLREDWKTFDSKRKGVVPGNISWPHDHSHPTLRYPARGGGKAAPTGADRLRDSSNDPKATPAMKQAAAEAAARGKANGPALAAAVAGPDRSKNPLVVDGRALNQTPVSRTFEAGEKVKWRAENGGHTGRYVGPAVNAPGHHVVQDVGGGLVRLHGTRISRVS